MIRDSITINKQIIIMYLKSVSLLLILAGAGISANCQNRTQQRDLNENLKWSARMANSVMTRYPELTDIHSKFYNSATKWSYDVALVAQAIDKLGSMDPAFEKYMQNYMDFFVGEDGEIATYKFCEFNLDKINPGNNLLILHERTGQEKYRKAAEQLIAQLEEQPHNPDGGFWHKGRYPYQMWLDGIYMSAPFMARYAQTFNEARWFEEVVRQITLIEGHTKDPETGLLYHAYDASRGMKWSDDETGCSPHFWGRAMGWYMMALVDALDFFPETHPGREELLGVLNRTSEAVAKVRDKESGLWYQVLDMGGSPGNYLEASASCMFVYAYAKGAHRGYLDEEYLSLAESSFESILEEFIVVEEDGLVSIDHGCFAAGPGGMPYRSVSYDYYINERKGKNDTKSVGPFILAAFELDR
jgi:unsaturated rhamnogalacturonyl hydrolase